MTCLGHRLNKNQSFSLCHSKSKNYQSKVWKNGMKFQVKINLRARLMFRARTEFLFLFLAASHVRLERDVFITQKCFGPVPTSIFFLFQLCLHEHELLFEILQRVFCFLEQFFVWSHVPTNQREFDWRSIPYENSIGARYYYVMLCW